MSNAGIVIFVLSTLVFYFHAKYKAESKRFLKLWEQHQRTVKSLTHWRNRALFNDIKGRNR